VTAAERYATPTAFRRALTDRLRTVAGTSRWTLPQLQRHVAYDRLLERLYLFDRGWVVKGASDRDPRFAGCSRHDSAGLPL
jgi:hypothetical protein